MYVLILFSCLKSEGIFGVSYIPWNFLGLRGVFCSNEVTVGPSGRGKGREDELMIDHAYVLKPPQNPSTTGFGELPGW